MSKIYKIGNYCNACCRRNCRYIFGSFFHYAIINQDDRVFDIQIHETLPLRQPDGTIVQKSIHEFVNIEKFKKFWGPQWRIIFIKSEIA